MPRKVSEVLVHIDLEESYHELRFQYKEQVRTSTELGNLREFILRPDRLEDETNVAKPFADPKGVFKVVADVKKNGVYLLHVKPYHRLAEVVVEPKEVVLDLFPNGAEAMAYVFYNPTNRDAITVSGYIVEDVDGFFRKLTTKPDNPVWRNYLVRRSLAGAEVNADSLYPDMMTAEQVAEYLQLEVKTIRSWTSQGKIPFVKMGGAVRYQKKVIVAAMEKGSLGNQAAKGVVKKSPPKERKVKT